MTMAMPKRSSRSILFMWISVIMLVSGVATVLFTSLLIYYRTNDVIEATDAQLLMAAEMSREILGPDYHNLIDAPSSVSPQQFKRIVERNDDLCRRLHLQYLWSVLSVNDQFVFTSATHSDIANPASPSAAFFEVHRDPESFRLAMKPEMKPVFSTFNNEWGKGRQVLVPRKDENGRTYIFGASVQMDEYNAILWQAVLAAIAIGLAVMGGAFLLTLMLARRLTIPITQLTETADQMAGGDLEVSLPLSGVKELQSLSDSLDQLRHGLKKRIKELNKSTALLDATQQLTRVGGWEWDVAQQSMFWTDETYRIHGFSPEEIPPGSTDHIDRSILCYEPDARPIIQAAFQNCIEKGLSYSLEVPFTNLLGERMWVRTQAEAVREKEKIVRVVGNIIDITERKLAEESIRESEEKYRLLIMNSHDIIYTLTADGKFTFVSPAWTVLLGHAVPQVIGQSFHKFVHPDDIPACMGWLKKVIETGERQEGIEYRVCHLNGAWYWHASSAVPLLDAAGVVVGFEGTARDITGRKLAEEAQRTSETQFRIVFEKTSVGYTLTSLEGLFLRVNQAFADMLGYKVEEMVGKNWADFTLAEDIQTSHDILVPLLAGDQNSAAFEKRYLRKDGIYVDVLISTTLLRDAQNTPMYFITNILDISKRKKTEEALRESEERFKSLHNASFGGIAIHDKGIILECNHGLSEMMGYSVDELLAGMDGLLLIAPNSRELVRNHIITGYEKPYEAFGLRKNGEIFPMRLEARTVPYKGKNVRTVEFRDITAQKLAEEKIREDQVELQRLLAETEHSRQALLSVVEDQKEAEEQIRQLNSDLEQRVQDRTAQLKAVNQELEAFSYSVSHDLRAPLRALDGFSGALISDYQEILDQQGLHYLSRIQEASHRMGQLIEDLLNLSRITRREINLDRVDLSRLARQIANDLHAQSPERQVEFEISPDLFIRADPGLIKIALENLLQNAVKYSSKKETALIQVGVLDQPGSEGCVYFVRDNGAGFDMAYADKLFTPFQRLHRTQEFPGTGIGLTIVQRIITRHGGHIWPEAAVNQGATFYFTLGPNDDPDPMHRAARQE